MPPDELEVPEFEYEYDARADSYKPVILDCMCNDCVRIREIEKRPTTLRKVTMPDVLLDIAKHDGTDYYVTSLLRKSITSVESLAAYIKEYSWGTDVARKVLKTFENCEVFVDKLNETGYKWDPKNKKPIAAVPHAR